jgi:lipopolysaccharide transport system ATP-binding protein
MECTPHRAHCNLSAFEAAGGATLVPVDDHGLAPDLALDVIDLTKQFAPPTQNRFLGRTWSRAANGSLQEPAVVDSEVEPLDAGDDDDDDEGGDEVLDSEQPPAGGLYALSKVSFSCRRGTGLAVVGPSGAGKSTLLRILARVTPPSAGRALVRGRVAPQMQVAASLFRSDQTLAGNVRLLARFFDVPRDIVERATPEIFAFAELAGREQAKLAHVPREFSRRLALSTVLHFEADLLLADDLVTVGARSFRERSLDRIEALIADGATLLFASHDLELVERLAHDVLWLDGGRVVCMGPRDEVLRRYRDALGLATKDTEAGRPSGGPPRTRRQVERNHSADAALVGAEVRSPTGEVAAELDGREPFSIAVTVDVFRPSIGLRFGVSVASGKGVGARATQDVHVTCAEPGRYVATLTLPPNLLADGTYLVRTGVEMLNEGKVAELVLAEAASFDVANSRAARTPPGGGKPRLRELKAPRWTLHRAGSITSGAAPV